MWESLRYKARDLVSPHVRNKGRPESRNPRNSLRDVEDETQ